MENLINFLRYSMPFVIAVSIVISLVISIRLYSDAPEKNEIGFNKYWQMLMMESYPSADKNLLIYDDKPERHKWFKIHRIVSVVGMTFIAANVVLQLLLT